MRKLFVVALVAALAIGAGPPAEAHLVKDASIVVATADVTITTTTETAIVTSGSARPAYATTRVLVIAWGQLTTGAATTAVTPRIRRGTTASGTLIGEGNAETLKAAAAGTEPFFIVATEDLGAVESVQYTLTLQQTAATGNGSALQAGIVVLLF